MLYMSETAFFRKFVTAWPLRSGRRSRAGVPTVIRSHRGSRNCTRLPVLGVRVEIRIFVAVGLVSTGIHWECEVVSDL